MKNTTKKIFRFLGSINFAIILIASTAAFVIAGTFIESKTDSHRHAALFTYESFLFKLLLCGFFLNILVSALRRWPFKLSHVPFLITHLGLLMILAGVLIKSQFGMQGTMSIIEGSASQEIFFPDRHALLIEAKDENFATKSRIVEIDHFPSGRGSHLLSESFQDLEITILHYAENCSQRLETWIKGDFGSVKGLKPFPVHEFITAEDSLPNPIKVQFPSNHLWNLMALDCSDVAMTIQKIYLESVNIVIRETSSGKIFYEKPLEEFLKTGIATTYGNLKGQLHLNWSPIFNLQAPQLLIELPHQKVEIPLEGEFSLINLSDRSFLGKAPFSIDLSAPPTLLFLQDPQKDLFLFAFDQHGQIFTESYRQDNLNSLIAYDEGFLGYAIQSKLPFLIDSFGREEKEKGKLSNIMATLSESSKNPQQLPSPLKLLYEACKRCQIDFAETTATFLSSWDHAGGWLMPYTAKMPPSLQTVLENLDWNAIPLAVHKGCSWNSSLFNILEPSLDSENDLIKILEKLHWPTIASIQAMRQTTTPCLLGEWPEILEWITLQTFAAAGQISKQISEIPSLQPPPSLAEINARLLSVYFRAYHLHLSDWTEAYTTFSPEQEAIHDDLKFQLETNLLASQRIIPSSKKLEDNVPRIVLKVKFGDQQEIHSFSYDRFGSGIKWPILNGKFLVRFQPFFKKLPYKLRLRQARQINYSNSKQPFSFESDLLVTNFENKETEKTISMNNVYETWDGYRFYLANISPPDEGALKRVQIAVNHDPAKYLMTYPGALILSLGILLLFWGPLKRRL